MYMNKSRGSYRDRDHDSDGKEYRGKGKRVQNLQAEVDEVAIILHTNVEKLLERGEKLDDLMDNADNLLVKASSFQTTAKKVKNQYKWRNRMYVIIGVVVVLLIVAIIVICVVRPWEK